MNPLVLLLGVASLSAGIALFQERAISDLHSATGRLSGQILETRASLKAEQAALETARARLKQLEQDRQTLCQERLAQAQTPQPPLPTPQQEGWWPEERPYFYFPKRHLARVRLDDRLVFQSQTNSTFSGLSARVNYTRATYQPFSDDGLNPHLAILLGLSDEEVVAVNDQYRDLVRGVREVEVSWLERVEPPVSEGEGDTPFFVIARLPVLTNEIQPLRERWEQAMDRTLGPTRGALLSSHAVRYFKDYLDDLGSEPREFLRHDGALSVRFKGPYGEHTRSAFALDWNCANFGQDWEYGHLFGPGAPGEAR